MREATGSGLKILCWPEIGTFTISPWSRCNTYREAADLRLSLRNLNLGFSLCHRDDFNHGLIAPLLLIADQVFDDLFVP